MNKKFHFNSFMCFRLILVTLFTPISLKLGYLNKNESLNNLNEITY